jgi:hypothetical protein
MTQQEVFGLKVAHKALKGRVGNHQPKPYSFGGATHLPVPFSDEGFMTIFGDLARHYGATGETPMELLQSLEQLHPQLKGG